VQPSLRRAIGARSARLTPAPDWPDAADTIPDGNTIPEVHGADDAVTRPVWPQGSVRTPLPAAPRR
jgi:hypothetical protein